MKHGVTCSTIFGQGSCVDVPKFSLPSSYLEAIPLLCLLQSLNSFFFVNFLTSGYTPLTRDGSDLVS